MEIFKLQSLTAENLRDLLALMAELDPNVPASAEVLQAAVMDPGTHFFVAMENGRIIGTASLCVTQHPLGRKGTIEDVVISSDCRGRHLGRALMEHILDYARRELSPIELALTSRPARAAANRLYQSLGFIPYETNVYKLPL